MTAELINISKHYKIPKINHIRKVLDNISFSINKGEAVAITGPSGSGKSTLLNILGTLDIPTSGIVKLNGKEINTYSEKKLAEIRNKNIGFIFQMHYLLPQLSLIENVLLPVIPIKDKTITKTAKTRAEELLASVGLSDKIHQRPGQLSGGECQRTAVVRALINNPKIILADEPTGSLDKKSSDKLGELLLKINKKHDVAMIVVTHSQKLAEKMNIIYKLDNGKLFK